MSKAKEVVLEDCSKVELIGMLNKCIADSVLAIDLKKDNNDIKSVLSNGLKMLDVLYNKI
jgi:hypothetical protein